MTAASAEAVAPDILYGGRGSDAFFDGDSGADSLSGGSGDDLFFSGGRWRGQPLRRQWG